MSQNEMGFFRTMATLLFTLIGNAWEGLWHSVCGNFVLNLILRIMLTPLLIIITLSILIFGVFFTLLIPLDFINHITKVLRSEVIKYLESLVQEAKSGPLKAVYCPIIIVILVVGLIGIYIINFVTNPVNPGPPTT